MTFPSVFDPPDRLIPTLFPTEFKPLTIHSQKESPIRLAHEQLEEKHSTKEQPIKEEEVPVKEETVLKEENSDILVLPIPPTSMPLSYPSVVIPPMAPISVPGVSSQPLSHDPPPAFQQPPIQTQQSIQASQANLFHQFMALQHQLQSSQDMSPHHQQLLSRQLHHSIHMLPQHQLPPSITPSMIQSLKHRIPIDLSAPTQPPPPPQRRVHTPSAPRTLSSQALPGQHLYEATYSNVPVYEFLIHDHSIMRRKHDGWINATHILKLAGIEKGRRTKILEKEVHHEEHEKIQGGYGKYQGTWIPLMRAKELSVQYGVADILSPILDLK